MSSLHHESDRIRPIDAARGSAMLFVFLSHFVVVYFVRNQRPALLTWVVTLIASPAFICISGVMLGILFSTRRDRFSTSHWKYVWRGIFLLTVGRFLIYLAHVPISGGWGEALRWGFITDPIGFCFIIGPSLMQRVNRRQRMMLGGLMYGFCWLLVLWWMPIGATAGIVKETLFGSFRSDLRFYTEVFPIVPWLSFFIVATGVGEILGDQILRRRQDKIPGIVFRIGAISAATGVCLFVIRFFLIHGLSWPIDGRMYLLTSPLQKLPPGPAYFLFYGGCAFLMLFFLMRFRTNRVVEKYSLIVEVLGRNSLFAFIVQYFVYFCILAGVNVPLTSLWPLYFLVSAVVIWGFTFMWEKGEMNRYLTIPTFRSVRGSTSKS